MYDKTDLIPFAKLNDLISKIIPAIISNIVSWLIIFFMEVFIISTNFDFNDRPDAARISLVTGSSGEAELSVLFLNFQWAYREMQRQYDQILANSDLTESKFIILMFLGQANQKQLSPSEIADKLGATRATVTKLLKGLVAKKWVQRLASDTDKRSAMIQLTELGQQIVTQFLPHNFSAVQTIMGTLSTDEVTQLNKLLKKVNQGTQHLKQQLENNNNNAK
ncbi:MarR family winged helix-turn-helix transcriptional regulator [Companilactobacillus jidongensis]|uniref:MarR family winged helix-turn-helix transcriptional regulator n=1 Tax=Companilactobacillus jidongensis TaxID=2486006 RepID=UPI001CDC9D3C|nr:MarR family transcriptional regulator [Companilactobacillus jidongensis]